MEGTSANPRKYSLMSATSNCLDTLLLSFQNMTALDLGCCHRRTSTKDTLCGRRFPIAWGSLRALSRDYLIRASSNHQCNLKNQVWRDKLSRSQGRLILRFDGTFGVERELHLSRGTNYFRYHFGNYCGRKKCIIFRGFLERGHWRVQTNARLIGSVDFRLRSAFTM